MTAVSIWRCPHCRGELTMQAHGASCVACGAVYESFGGVLDLRPRDIPWIDYEKEAAEARRMVVETAVFDAEQTVRYVFAARPNWDERRVEKFTRQVLQAPLRLRREINGWLSPVLSKEGVLLDLGCGPAMLCAAAALEGYRAIGLDVSLVWLMVGRKLVAEHGGDPQLVAAVAQALPLADGSVTGVASLDVIEHVGDVGGYLAEIDRVLAPGGYVAMATPNRFSLAAEPHTSLWGVGWLPRRLQRPYVRWRIKDPYEGTSLLSAGELKRLFRQHTRIEISIRLPRLTDEAMAYFPLYRRVLARLYNAMSGLAVAGPILRHIGAFFQIVGRRQ